MALARGLEVRQERLGPVHDTPEVDAEQPLEVLVGHGLDRRAERDPRVVDDQVDFAVVGHDLLGPGLDGGPVGHVHVLRGDLDTAALALRHRLGPPGVVDVRERQMRPALRQLVGQGAPDARSRSRDRRHAAVEAAHRQDAASMSSSAPRVTGAAPNSMKPSSTGFIFSAR